MRIMHHKYNAHLHRDRNNNTPPKKYDHTSSHIKETNIL